MSWSAPTTAMILAEFTPAEQSKIETIQGSTAHLAAILGRVVAEVRDFIRSGGYDLDADTTKIPAGLHNDAISIARMRWIAVLPVSALATEERVKAADAALEKLGKIASQKFAVEPPSTGETPTPGNWNSNNKVLGRTHPGVRPGQQATVADNNYANPDAPDDSANEA